MNIKERQLGLEDVSQEYQAFVDKFKPKLTTDDCYTPENVYETVRAWVFAHYDLPEDTPVVRPFWPGGDYQRADYPAGCVVIDNPPFSLLSEIERFYLVNEIAFFLFALGLSLFKPYAGLHYVNAGNQIVYHNGAKVPTGFVTSLGEYLMETAPDLYEQLEACNRANSTTAEIPKYAYPIEVVTAARLNWLSVHGTHWRCRPEDAQFVRKLDSQGKKALFGAGFLISPRAAAERAAAERIAAERAAAERAAAEHAAAERENVTVWTLSDREKKIIERLGGEKHDD